MSLVGCNLNGFPGLVYLARRQQRPPELVVEAGDIGIGLHRCLAGLHRPTADLIRQSAGDDALQIERLAGGLVARVDAR